MLKKKLCVYLLTLIMLTSFHNFNNADNFTHNLLNKYYLNIKSNLHILIILLHCWIILSHNIVACEIRIRGLVACSPLGKAVGFN